MSAERFRVIVPARYGSTRLPGKPLVQLGGKPMVAHVLARALESGAEQVLVATDDVRIAEAVRAAGGLVVMTSSQHATGTDRVAEVARLEGLDEQAIVVNLQGDEPLVQGSLLSLLARQLSSHHDCGIATLATPIVSSQELFDPNIVKVTRDQVGRALTFSRAPIPWVRGLFSATFDGALPADVPFLRHVGLYAYRVGTLHRIASAPQDALERAESLEQLRALAMGIRIHVSVVAEAPGQGVDTAEDVERVNQRLLTRDDVPR